MGRVCPHKGPTAQPEKEWPNGILGSKLLTESSIGLSSYRPGEAQVGTVEVACVTGLANAEVGVETERKAREELRIQSFLPM